MQRPELCFGSVEYAATKDYCKVAFQLEDDEGGNLKFDHHIFVCLFVLAYKVGFHLGERTLCPLEK